jgi:two-component system response regulator
VNQLANILLVEDNPNDVELTLRAFAANRITNEIAVVRDGAEALDYVLGDAARASALSVILLDLKLPKVDGLDVLKQLKSDQASKHIPVVIMTSSQEESDRIATYDLGANSYIVKPVDFEKFTESVRLIGLYWLLLNLPAISQSSS